MRPHSGRLRKSLENCLVTQYQRKPTGKAEGKEWQLEEVQTQIITLSPTKSRSHSGRYSSFIHTHKLLQITERHCLCTDERSHRKTLLKRAQTAAGHSVNITVWELFHDGLCYISPIGMHTEWAWVQCMNNEEWNNRVSLRWPTT